MVDRPNPKSLREAIEETLAAFARRQANDPKTPQHATEHPILEKLEPYPVED